MNLRLFLIGRVQWLVGQNSEYVQSSSINNYHLLLYHVAILLILERQIFRCLIQYHQELNMLYRIMSEFCEMREEGPNLIWGNH